MTRRYRTISILILFTLVFNLFAPTSSARATIQPQTLTPEELAENYLENLTPKERVGQLFLVSFDGTDLSEEAAIHDLITNYHIGGVILRAKNNNFVGPEDTLTNVITMTRGLQEIAWGATEKILDDTITDESYRPKFTPLFIGISQEGNGYPHDQIFNELTKLPSFMALGATWNPSLAESTGETMGAELAELGFNLLIGPSLDVLASPSAESQGDIGVRSFGGDPYWVGQMGQKYVEGVRTGSDGQLLIFAKHFPGQGGSDRPLEEEVATIRKSLDQLRQIELVPFFDVTRLEANEPISSTVDGLVVSHIRYQGFAGNIRANTRPVSLDEQTLNSLMTLDEFSPWHENGGLLLSDDLGNQAIRRYSDPSGSEFNARLVVRDAFLAGNDMLYLGNILGSADPDSITTIRNVLNFFATKYNEDVAFASRVDASVLRILTKKYSLYDSFTLNQVLTDFYLPETIGQNKNLTFEIALDAATLINEDTVLPDPPTPSDRLVFVTDTLNFQQCATCELQTSIPQGEFQRVVLQLYGPNSGNQILERNLSSFSFDDLTLMLDGQAPNNQLENNLSNATWVVFAMNNVSTRRTTSLALRRFLSERTDLTSQKRIIVFAFDAPYYLDTTDITKLTAYYGMYSHAPEFVEVAARILFQEVTVPQGASPVSIEGIGYELIDATSPEENQIIPLILDIPVSVSDVVTPTQEIPAEPVYQIGEIIPLKTGVVLDHNDNPVPDGTPVQFIFSLAGEDNFPPPVFTTDGIARTTYTVANAGPLQIRAVSEPATQSEILTFEIPASDATPEPTPTLEPTPTQTLLPTPAITAEPTANSETIPTEPENEPYTIGLTDWFVAMLTSLLAGYFVFRMSALAAQPRWSIRLGLSAVIGGMLFFNYLGLGLPGAVTVLDNAGRAGVLWVVFFGAGVGMFVGILWWIFSQMRRQRTYNVGKIRPTGST